MVPRAAIHLRDAASAASVAASQNQTTNLDGFIIVLMVIAAICIVLRVVSRKLADLDLQRDDWLFIAGGILSEGLFIVSAIYSFRAGLGAHWSTLTPDQMALFPKLNYAYNILTLTSYPLIKLSILFLYLRIFVATRFRYFVWAGIVFVSCMMVANTFVTIFACQPIRSFFDMTVKGECVNLYSFYWATAILNVITDIYILAIPMPIVWRIQTTLKRKIAFSAIFVLGGLTFIVGLVRIAYYLKYDASDPSYSFLGTAYANPAEICLGIMVASAPTCRPMYIRSIDTAKRLYSSVRSGSMRMSKHDSSSDNESENEKSKASHTKAEGLAASAREEELASKMVGTEDAEDHTNRWKFQD